MLKKRDAYLKNPILSDDGNNWKEVADATIKNPWSIFVKLILSAPYFVFNYDLVSVKT